mmetsp:Transcript_28743/g.56465  ORF Transcript_28743/g.56465 Transcript_28743/m.56465 type:complete len:235 (-) Transcript_28743:443-1147(-)
MSFLQEYDKASGTWVQGPAFPPPTSIESKSKPIPVLPWVAEIRKHQQQKQEPDRTQEPEYTALVRNNPFALIDEDEDKDKNEPSVIKPMFAEMSRPTMDFPASSSTSSLLSKEVKFDLDELEGEITEMQEQEKREVQDKIERDSAAIRNENNAFAALPSQSEESLALHTSIVDRYNKIYKIGVDPKKNFLTKKSNRKQQRRLKKAEAHQDKSSYRPVRAGDRKRQARKAARAMY